MSTRTASDTRVGPNFAKDGLSCTNAAVDVSDVYRVRHAFFAVSGELCRVSATLFRAADTHQLDMHEQCTRCLHAVVLRGGPHNTAQQSRPSDLAAWLTQEGIAEKGGLYGLGTTVMDQEPEDDGWWVHSL